MLHLVGILFRHINCYNFIPALNIATENTSLVLSQCVTENKETPHVRCCSKSAIRVIEIVIISYRITTCFNYFNTLILMHITCYVPNKEWDLCLLTLYTGCPRRNVRDFGRVFLMLNYTDITKNTYIQSWTVTEIMAREVWNFDSCYTLIDYQFILKLAGICGFCNVNICT